jgi:hypothetical protein
MVRLSAPPYDIGTGALKAFARERATNRDSPTQDWRAISIVYSWRIDAASRSEQSPRDGTPILPNVTCLPISIASFNLPVLTGVIRSCLGPSPRFFRLGVRAKSEVGAAENV